MEKKDLKKILAGLCVAGLLAAPACANNGGSGDKSDAGGVKSKQEAGKSG